MAYLPSVVLSLIPSLGLVPLARHNMRGQMHVDSSACSLAREHLPPSSARLPTWRAAGYLGWEEGKRTAGGWAGKEVLGMGLPGRRSRCQDSLLKPGGVKVSLSV